MNSLQNYSKNRIAGFDFARAVSAAGIFAVHFIQEAGMRTAVPDGVIIAAREWGFIFVTVFFIMSGALLQMRHPFGSRNSAGDPDRPDSARGEKGADGKHSLAAFYRKRAASIYPMFYLVYIIVLAAWLAAGKETPAHLLRPEILFTAAGMDGYFASSFDTCYLVGEWFLGALIILYILFPALSYAAEKCEPLLWAALLVLYVCFMDRPLLSQAPVTNIFSCLICFAMGISFGRHGLHSSKRIYILGLAVFIISLIPAFRNMAGMNISSHITGAGLFILLLAAGGPVMNRRLPGRILGFTGDLSYPFYLVHHVITGAGLNYLFRHVAAAEQSRKYLPAAALLLFAVSLAAAWIMDRVLKILKGRNRQKNGKA